MSKTHTSEQEPADQTGAWLIAQQRKKWDPVLDQMVGRDFTETEDKALRVTPGIVETSGLGAAIHTGAMLAATIDGCRLGFQRRCNQFSQEQLGFEVFGGPDDPYELLSKPWVDVDPEAFVREHFAEDFARLQVEEEERREAGTQHGEED